MEPRGTSSSRDGNNGIAAVTVDVHDSDDAEDIHAAASVLASHEIRGTFFVPAALFGSSRHIEALRALPHLQHEIGSHGFDHDWSEIDALVYGTAPSQLQFLERSRAAFEDFYGHSPRVFRSPLWCRLNDMALDELARLGYQVDSSATPQRSRVLSSRPFDPGWFRSPRSPHLLRPDLLEVPNSTALLPAGSPTFRIMRRRLSVLFVRMLYAEASLRARVLVLQFDSRDLNARAVPEPRRRLAWRDLLPQREGGFGFRRRLSASDPGAIAATADRLLCLLSSTSTSMLTLSEVRLAWLRRTS